MPRAAQPSPMVRRGSKERRGAPRRAELTLVLTWSVPREAAAVSELAGAGGRPVLEVRVPWRGGMRRVEAGLVDADVRAPVDAGPGRGRWLGDAGLWHLDIPGVLSLSVREAGGGLSVLYARCELLSHLGLEGGRYEFQGACVARS